MQSNKFYRIIDANLNRATEGLRVVEEICRFVIEDKTLALEIKKIRSNLAKTGKSLIDNDNHYQYRNAWQDIGRRFYTENEGRRRNVEDVFRANIKRAQEAVRCLEEFSKLLKPMFGKRFKSLRFKLYELEKQIAPKVSKAAKLDFTLYAVTDPARDHLRIIRMAVAGGVKIVQLRDKAISKQKYFRLARRAAKIVRKAGAVFILNDYWDFIKKVGADGVHLGQEDIAKLSIRRVRKEIGADKIIGVSTHSYEQAKRAEKLGADYISVGPIFKTPSKPNNKPVGLKLLRKVLRRVNIPVVAIGGIDRSNVHYIRKAGGQRFAAIRAAEELAGG